MAHYNQETKSEREERLYVRLIGFTHNCEYVHWIEEVLLELENDI